MKKYLNYLAWISTIVALVLMLFGFIAFLAGGRFMAHNWANYFYPAMNFLLLAIVLLLFQRIGMLKKD
jgi:hypothetical protein